MPARSYCLICWMAAAALIGCGGRDPESTSPRSDVSGGLQSVQLVLNWRPEAEHGGYYAALVHGYYKDVGLDVTIIPGGPGAPVIPKVLADEGSFGVTNADRILLGRAQQANVVAVMAPIQDSPRCIIVRKASGITEFENLHNLTVAVSATSTFAQFMKKQGLLRGVHVVPYDGSAGQFLTDRVDAQQGYSFSEPFVAERLGGDPHCLMVSKLGFNPYTSVLFTDRQVIADQPTLVRKLVAASIRGWQKYLVAPDQTNRHIRQLNPEMDLDILAFGAQALQPLCQAPEESFGQMSLTRWRVLTNQLQQADTIDAGSIDPKQAFTTRFLDLGVK